MSETDSRTPGPDSITSDPDCVPRACAACGRPVTLGWTGKAGRTLRPVTVDAGLFGDVLTPHLCDE